MDAPLIIEYAHPSYTVWATDHELNESELTAFDVATIEELPELGFQYVRDLKAFPDGIVPENLGPHTDV